MWRRSRHTVDSSLMGPHFEGICREWARWHADPETYGDRYPGRVASGTVSDPAAKMTLQVDVAAFGLDDEDRGHAARHRRGQVAGDRHRQPPEETGAHRDLLIARGAPGADTARLLLFSGTGFSDAIIKRAEDDPSIQLIGLDRLYHGA